MAAIDREASPRDASEMVRWVIEARCDEVLGIGIDYRENDRPPELFVDAYRAARRAGLRTTAHAGEFGTPWTHVQTAVDLLQVDRIDHGYTVVDAPDFAARCAERGIVFTVVPTNSYYLRTLPPERWALDHPIRRMPGLGLRVHPNTDDPTLHHVTPTQAWGMMVRDFGFGLDDLRAFMLNGLDGAWIDDGTRRAWRAGFLPLRRAAPGTGVAFFFSLIPTITDRLQTMNRSPMLKTVLWGVAALLVTGAAQAQPAWPAAKPITLIVPFTAGGSVDATARLLAEQLG